MATLTIVLGIAVFFYLFIPGAGAFGTRSGWRLFRKRIIAASLFPFVTYRDLHGDASGCLGRFRFIGSLQAISGEHLVWLGDGRNTVSVDLVDTVVHLLPPEEKDDEKVGVKWPLPDETVRSVRWDELSSLSEGTRFFVAGPLHSVNGRPVFRSTEDTPLVVVISDRGDKELLPVSIWTGRQRNEYWNRFTPASIAVGFLLHLILSYSYLKEPIHRVPAILSLTLSLAPVALFLPPGVFLFSLYRWLWREGRISRGERDIVLLPFRYFDSKGLCEESYSGVLPDGSEYSGALFPSKEEALKAVAEGERVWIAEITSVKTGKEVRSWFLFGARTADGLFTAPKDPMAGLILFPGNPAELSRMCAARARKMELLAAAAFCLAFGMNTFLVLFVLALIIR